MRTTERHRPNVRMIKANTNRPYRKARVLVCFEVRRPAAVSYLKTPYRSLAGLLLYLRRIRIPVDRGRSLVNAMKGNDESADGQSQKPQKQGQLQESP
jgi:hypothetical protein